jgi:putative ABC transport system ATP-binding protein
MIKIRNLNKFYRIGSEQFHALKNIDLEINTGEMVAIQGRSGAGKSTLLNIIGCLDNYNSGAYKFNNIEIRELNDSKLAKFRNQYIGFVLQDFSLLNQKSVLFNTSLPLYFNKTPYSKIKKSATEALDSVGILDQIKKKANQLSGGQRQRVAIARAIINNTPVILADEPTGNLDSTTADEIINIFKRLNSEGKTIIIVTHDDYIASFCNRIITINDGKII